MTDLEKLLFDTLKDLVDAFPGDAGLDVACGFGADGYLVAAKNLIHQIHEDILDLNTDHEKEVHSLEMEIFRLKREVHRLNSANELKNNL